VLGVRGHGIDHKRMTPWVALWHFFASDFGHVPPIIFAYTMYKQRLLIPNKINTLALTFARERVV
jgi:hypothetical protein